MIIGLTHNKDGKPITAKLRSNPNTRFWSKVQKAGPNECWLWIGPVSRDGYGCFTVSDNWRPRAHQFAYIYENGGIPEAHHIDHLCGNRRCVNPAHLQAVPPRTNVLRGGGPPARNARKTHCSQGHEFTPENTYTYVMTVRRCRKCAAQKARAQRRNHA